MKPKKNTILSTSLAIAVVLVIAALWYFAAPPSAPALGGGSSASAAPPAPASSSTPALSGMDAFAECLAQKGFTMYGLYSCPHCQAEKALFGDSFRYVDYVECSADPNRCTAEGIDAVPTWIGPDGTRFVGARTLAQLSQASGCDLPAAD